MLHGGMGLVTVRVVPKAGRTSVGLDARGVAVPVRAVPEGGRAEGLGERPPSLLGRPAALRGGPYADHDPPVLKPDRGPAGLRDHAHGDQAHPAV